MIEKPIKDILPPLLSKNYDLKRITKSLESFGQTRTVVVSSDNVCIAGWGVVVAARKIGWDSVICEVSEQTADQLRGYRIADNRTAESARWDEAKLIPQFNEVGDYYTGFEDDEIWQLLDEPPLDPARLVVDNTLVLKYNKDEADIVAAWLDAKRKSFGCDEWAEVLFEVASA